MPYHCINTQKRQIRPLPYPFQMAVSISNDIEFFSFQEFHEFMKFLNSNLSTSLGSGLNLEITSSLFFYSVNHDTFSYFDGDNPEAPLSDFAPKIDIYLKSGWIDTIHAYGNFDHKGGFVRRHAERVFHRLQNLGVNISVFTNHGDENNIQNIGIDASYHKGDIPNSHAYHSDLLKKNNIRYIWTDSMVTQIRHERKVEKTNLYNVFSKKKTEDVLLQATLLNQVNLQDGANFIGFNRFRSTGSYAPNLSSLQYQCDVIPWNEMEKRFGVLVIYQHLGVMSKTPKGCIPVHLSEIKKRPESYLSGLYYIQYLAKYRRLWVVGLSRLLHYCEMIENVTIEEDLINKEVIIYYPDDILNPNIFFQGLTVYVTPDLVEKINYKGNYLDFMYNGPDHTGNYSITVIMEKMQNIWEGF